MLSEADKMFEELGYELILNNGRFENEEIVYLRYKKKFDETMIEIWNDKTISKTETNFKVGYITMSELQAINKKCEELGWLDVK